MTRTTEHSSAPFASLRRGGGVPAHPLAQIKAERRLEGALQRAPFRYYLVPVHRACRRRPHITIRDPRPMPLGPVHELAADEARHHKSHPYPELTEDDFVRENLASWLAPSARQALAAPTDPTLQFQDRLTFSNPNLRTSARARSLSRLHRD